MTTSSRSETWSNALNHGTECVRSINAGSAEPRCIGDDHAAALTQVPPHDWHAAGVDAEGNAQSAQRTGVNGKRDVRTEHCRTQWHHRKPDGCTKGCPEDISLGKNGTMLLLGSAPAGSSTPPDGPELLANAATRKDIGNAHCRNGRVGLAVSRYEDTVFTLECAVDEYIGIPGVQEADRARLKALVLACYLNSAACYLRLGAFTKAKDACEVVLAADERCVTPYYRLAQAECGLEHYLECSHACRAAVDLDPSNEQAWVLLGNAQVQLSGASAA